MSRTHGVLRLGLKRPHGNACAHWKRQQNRAIATSFLKRKDEAKTQWEGWAMEIRAGQRRSMLKVLEERGYVHSIAGEIIELENLMTDKRIGAYVGIDPTASSLHLGHLLPLMTLFWLYLHGFHTVSLIGSATSKIGDPTGRISSRAEMTTTERKANVVSMHYQLKKLWLNVEKMGAKHGYVWEKYWHRGLLNNGVWWNKTPLTEVLTILGHGMRMGTMLGRDTAKTKLLSPEGMSLAEFCYPVMQAWDWWVMYEANDIQLQIGGADQFGNILSGVDAVKYIQRNHPDPVIRKEGITRLNTPFGLTVPLLTTSTGEKFGKSAGNAIWLDREMTSAFDLYGFFVRTSDADIERFLKFFTFLPMPKIISVMHKHKDDPAKRLAQHTLAAEFIELVHGEEIAKATQKEHKALFDKPTISSLLGTAQNPQHPAPRKSNPLATNQNLKKRKDAEFWASSLNKHAVAGTQNNAPATHAVLPRSLVYNQSIAKVLYSAGLASSRSEGHRLAQSKGAYIGCRASGHQPMGDELSFTPAKLMDPMQTWNNVIRDDEASSTMEKEGEEGLLILRQGKWRIRVCRLVSDEKFETMGLEDPPGWLEYKALQKANKIKDLEDWEAVEAEEKVKRLAARETQKQSRINARKSLQLANNSNRFRKVPEAKESW